MKTLIFLMVLVLTMTTQAQNAIELNEARVKAYPLFEEMSRNGNNFSVNIRENYPGEFEKYPTGFLKNNFDINEFIALTRDLNYDSYQVTLKSRNGMLKANYDRDGKLGKTFYKFKNVDLPYALKQQIYLDNKGWSIVKNSWIAKGREGMTEKNIYRIKLKNGNKTRQIKISPDLQEEIAMTKN